MLLRQDFALSEPEIHRVDVALAAQLLRVTPRRVQQLAKAGAII